MVSLFLLGLILSVVASIPYCTQASVLSKKEQIKNYCTETAKYENFSDVDCENHCLSDLDSNVFYAVQGVNKGFMVYDSVSGLFLEKSNSMVSPYDFVNHKDNYYFGPMEYYYKENNSFYSYFDGRKYSFEVRQEIQKEFNQKLTVLRSSSSNHEEKSHVSPTTIVVDHNFYIDNYQYIRDAKYPKNRNGSCGYVAASIVLYYWSKTTFKGTIPSSYLDSNGELINTDDEDPYHNLNDKLVSIAGKEGSWGKTVADTLNKYCKEFNIKGSAGYGLLDYGINNELSKQHPVILFGSLKDPNDGSRINHAVTCYGFQRYGTGPHPSSFYYIVNFGWQNSDTAEVLLNGAMLGSVTYFGLDVNYYKG